MDSLTHGPVAPLATPDPLDFRRKFGFRAGRVVGWAVAPFFALVSFVRQSRTFHPRGPTLHASLLRHPATPPELTALADGLLGQALVRFSGALWKRSESLPDVLGCAIRFRRDDTDSAEPNHDDQDLLFATIRRPISMPFAPLTTRIGDYFANDYFAVSPFDVGLSQPVYFRLHPEHRSPDASGRRQERLLRQVARGSAALFLELGPGPYGPWFPLLTVRLERLALIDGEALRFRPFRQGRGLRPRGFVHALRLGVYALSQRARPRRSASAG